MTDQSISQPGGREGDALSRQPVETAVGEEPVPVTLPPEPDGAAPGEGAARLAEPELPYSTPLPASPPRAEAARPAYVTRGQAVWLALLSSLLTLCLASTLSLSFLGAINGGLRYARPAQLGAVQERLDGMNLQAAALQSELAGLDNRLAALEDLEGRVAGVEAEMEQARRTVEDAANQVAGFQTELERLSLQVDALLTRAGRFQAFIDGLEGLMQTLAEPEVP